jgi:hypothetical protein
MFGTTMMLTVGQALDRARSEGTRIRIHVAGEWIAGTVMNTDSQAAMIASDDGEVCVVRMDSIACVRLPMPDRATPVPSQPTDSRVDTDAY